MYSLNGLIYGNTIKTNENLHAYEGRRVIITILDETVENPNQLAHNALDLKRKNAARELAGMWETGQNEETVDDIVRNGLVKNSRTDTIEGTIRLSYLRHL